MSEDEVSSLQEQLRKKAKRGGGVIPWDENDVFWVKLDDVLEVVKQHLQKLTQDFPKYVQTKEEKKCDDPEFTEYHSALYRWARAVEKWYERLVALQKGNK